MGKVSNRRVAFGRAFPRRAVHFDCALVSTNNAQHRRKPQPSTGEFGRKEGLEDLRKRVLIHAVASCGTASPATRPGRRPSAGSSEPSRASGPAGQSDYTSGGNARPKAKRLASTRRLRWRAGDAAVRSGELTEALEALLLEHGKGEGQFQ
jgi:hypothetical protein